MFYNSPFPPRTTSYRCLWVRDIWPVSATLCPNRNRNCGAAQVINEIRKEK